MKKLLMLACIFSITYLEAANLIINNKSGFPVFYKLAATAPHIPITAYHNVNLGDIQKLSSLHIATSTPLNGKLHLYWRDLSSQLPSLKQKATQAPQEHISININ